MSETREPEVQLLTHFQVVGLQTLALYLGSLYGLYKMRDCNWCHIHKTRAPSVLLKLGLKHQSTELLLLLLMLLLLLLLIIIIIIIIIIGSKKIQLYLCLLATRLHWQVLKG